MTPAQPAELTREQIEDMRSQLKSATGNLWAEIREPIHRKIDALCDLALRALSPPPQDCSKEQRIDKACPAFGGDLALYEALRSWAQNEEMINSDFLSHGRDCNEAAAAIERLVRELDQWREDYGHQLSMADAATAVAHAAERRAAIYQEYLDSEGLRLANAAIFAEMNK